MQLVVRQQIEASGVGAFVCCCVGDFQPVSGQLQLSYCRQKPELRLHELRQLRLGLIVCISPYDSGLLGKSVPTGQHYRFYSLLAASAVHHLELHLAISEL